MIFHFLEYLYSWKYFRCVKNFPCNALPSLRLLLLRSRAQRMSPKSSYDHRLRSHPYFTLSTHLTALQQGSRHDSVRCACLALRQSFSSATLILAWQCRLWQQSQPFDAMLDCPSLSTTRTLSSLPRTKTHGLLHPCFDDNVLHAVISSIKKTSSFKRHLNDPKCQASQCQDAHGHD